MYILIYNSFLLYIYVNLSYCDLRVKRLFLMNLDSDSFKKCLVNTILELYSKIFEVNSKFQNYVIELAMRAIFCSFICEIISSQLTLKVLNSIQHLKKVTFFICWELI